MTVPPCHIPERSAAKPSWASFRVLPRQADAAEQPEPDRLKVKAVKVDLTEAVKDEVKQEEDQGWFVIVVCKLGSRLLKS